MLCYTNFTLDKKSGEEAVEILGAKRRTSSKVLARGTTEATLSRQVNAEESTGASEWQKHTHTHTHQILGLKKSLC